MSLTMEQSIMGNGPKMAIERENALKSGRMAVNMLVTGRTTKPTETVV